MLSTDSDMNLISEIDRTILQGIVSLPLEGSGEL